jgi:TRAP-type C4-dicarboxylate transport system substrate-binding protein
VRRLAAVIGALLLAMAPARAQEPVTLRVIDSLPAAHFLHDTVTRPFMAAVTAATGGQVRFALFPAEQLGKARDLLRLTQHGVGDIGYVVPSYAPDKMPLSAVAELPGGFDHVCQGTRALWALTREGAPLWNLEFARSGVRPLVVFMVPAYQLLLSTHRTVDGLAAVRGLKLRTAGGAMDVTVRALGAVPVRVGPGELYESLSRGTLDGALFSYLSAHAYKLEGLLRRGTLDGNFGTVALTYSINETRWRSLAPAVQEALAREGERISFEACGKIEAEERRSAAMVQAAGAMTPLELPEADRRQLQTLFADVRRDWAETLDRRGQPGTAVLQAWDAAIREAGL